MLLIPTSVTHEAVAAEVLAATAWADRHSLPLTFDAEALRIEVLMAGPSADGTVGAQNYLLVGELDSFPAIAPAWTFLHPETRETGAHAFPMVPSSQFGPGLFIQGGPTGWLICAPFNRLAYAEHQGVHGDWGGATTWKTPRSPYTAVTTIGGMLDRIWREVLQSTGRASGR